MEPAKDQCAYYFAKERITNLQIRVSLQQLTGSQLVAVSPRDLEVGSGGREEEEIPLVPLANSALPLAESTSSFTQHSVIKWQHKLLSPCEIVEFSRPVYADNPKYKTLHEQAIKHKRRKKRKHRIFTYQHEDHYQYQNESCVSTSKKMEPMSWLRQRKNVAENTAALRSQDTGESIHTTEKKSNKKYADDTSPHQQYFYIMADLAPTENLGETQAYEVVLCELRFDTQGQLTVTPDFTRPATKPHRIESYGADNAQYEYKIENISPIRSLEEHQQEARLAEQLSKQRIEEVHQVAGLEWEDGGERKEGEVRLVVTGEITRALHFDDASSLYVHYALYLPPGWSSNSGSECEGFTPSCVVSYIDGVPTANYSTPFSLDLTRHQSGRSWPLLLLAAYSVDWLGRDRDEGYASFTLPTPGDTGRNDDNESVHTVAMWRPAQTSPLDKMRRFFLGGCQLITDFTYLALPVSTQVERVSRLGFNTVSSGSVELRVSSVVQADFTHTDYGMVVETPPGWQISTLAVIDAFNRSRQKLRAAKQGL
ncbi:hypothetical protein Pcinc_025715 [Petrolisthes cinctipes]|uniref:Meckel syndrome type 1 protein n=1 Tax=Petrolisthes cinctipes TaxID=88211 RepID=A0AAE1F9B5_PETCI|nr:hypothetical protein Pcinc_025715 [Petrolisthes cinctipes]